MNSLTSDWQTFFGAELSATASLTGLVFVAISVNLARITAHELLPGRAAEALFALTGGVLISSLMLVPRQSATAQGTECLVIGGVALLAQLRVQWRAHRSSTPNSLVRPGLRASMTLVAGVPFVAAGVMLCEGGDQGLYWAAGGVILELVIGVIGAWVLLVEIVR